MSVYTNMAYVSLKWHLSNEVFLLLFLLTPPSWGGLDPGFCTWSVKASVTWLCCTPSSQVELDDEQKSWGWTWPKDGSKLYMFHSGAWAITTVSPLIHKVNVVAHIAFYYCDLFPNTLCWLLLTLLLPFKLWNLLFFLHSQLTGSVSPQKGHFSVMSSVICVCVYTH